MKPIIILQIIGALGLASAASGCGEEVEAMNRAAKGLPPFAAYENAADREADAEKARDERQAPDIPELDRAERDAPETPLIEEKPRIEEDGDRMIVTSPDGNSRAVVTQHGGDAAETRVTTENGATVIERRSEGGSVTIIQGSGVAMNDSAAAGRARRRMEEMRSRILSRMFEE